MIIVGEKVMLRAIERADLPSLLRWSNDPDVAMGLGEMHFPRSMEQQENWFDGIVQDQKTVRLAVQNIDEELIGYTGYWDINWRAGYAEHGLLIGTTEYRAQGYGKDIIRTASRYAFEEMGWHRLDASILSFNEASLNCYQACGFKIEGIRREHDLRRGKRVDRVMLGLLASEFAVLDTRSD